MDGGPQEEKDEEEEPEEEESPEEQEEEQPDEDEAPAVPQVRSSSSRLHRLTFLFCGFRCVEGHV